MDVVAQRLSGEIDQVSVAGEEQHLGALGERTQHVEAGGRPLGIEVNEEIVGDEGQSGRPFEIILDRGDSERQIELVLAS